MNQKALVPKVLSAKGDTAINNILVILFGAIFIAVLAQVKVPLPWTPVPVTGQTFGVGLMALLFGSKRGMGAMALYIVMGVAGLPVFASLKSGFVWGPTSGYLIGMLVSAFIVGSLADRGWTDSVWSAWFAGLLGSAAVFGFGLLGLSFFIPADQLLMAGMFPFLPGDMVKTFLAAVIARQTSKFALK
jgi:biotin transport system substrate-specific component